MGFLAQRVTLPFGQVQLEQLEQFRVKYVTQKREERREGQLIKQRVEAYIEAEKMSETKKKMVNF